MGPTQSAVAWPGCAEDEHNYQEGLPNKNDQQGLQIKKDYQGLPNKPEDSGQAMAAQQQLSTHDEQLAPPQPQYFDDTEHESHEVSVNPVYEFALCRKIKETFRKVDTGDGNSQVGTDRKPSSVSDHDSRADSVVSVQPQSLASGDEIQSATDVKETDTHLDSRPSIFPTKNAEDRTPGISERNANPIHPKTHEANSSEDQTEITQTNQEVTEIVPQKDQTLATTDRQIQTETKATQTTHPHPGDISLSPPPPPRPLMISVSTPPDETSPMFYKLSHPQGSYLTDDIPSSPDVESDASEAGYAHLRARFGSDGGAAAAGAAAGASDSSPGEIGRRKRSKKKEEKSIDYVLRALNNLGSPQEKLTAVCKKYTDLHEEQRGLNVLLKQHQRRLNIVQREKDQLQLEHNKAMMSKSKLESLCRELQKQNKLVKDESLLRLKEEEERRKQMSAKFQKSLSDIQAQVNENHDQNLKLRAENQELSGRLKTFLAQHQQREQQLDQLSHHRDLELQLAEARLQQASAVLREEQEIHVLEKEKILLQATEEEKKNAILEAELSTYKTRYDEFQDSITKSSHTFHRLKSDMDRMGNRMKKLEKEGEQWRTKWETTNKTLQEVMLEKSHGEKENHTLQTKVTKLESLCRALQGQLRETSKATHTPQSSPEAPSLSSTDSVTTTTTTTTTSSSPEEASEAL